MERLASFTKMHGLGNDFVIFRDSIEKDLLSPALMRHIANRRYGIGCDQSVIIEQSSPTFLPHIRFFNADGSESDSCGNASRCVGYLLMQENNTLETCFTTNTGMISCERDETNSQKMTVNLGQYSQEWHDVPLAESLDTLHVPITEGELSDPVAVNVGNPHLVFFVPDNKAVPLAKLGPLLESHPLLPERANIGIVQIDRQDHFSLRVWERGAGETLACGTGACASVIAATRRHLSDSDVTVTMQGGDLRIRITDDHSILMQGDVASVYTGTIDLNRCGLS